jgi:hypothetical protein
MIDDWLSRQPIPFFVRDIASEPVTYKMKLSAKVSELRKLLSEREHIPIEFLWMTYRGRVLKDDRDLGYYKIKEHVVIELLARFR